jgi:hypothetical protein
MMIWDTDQGHRTPPPVAEIVDWNPLRAVKVDPIVALRYE